jgi:hypothetical protein
MRNLRNLSSGRIGQFAILVLFVILWQTLQIATTRSLLGEEHTADRQINVISEVSKRIIKSGDIVFLSTKSAVIGTELDNLGASVNRFNSNDATGFDTQLILVLDRFCNLDQEMMPPVTYFVWTVDSQQTIMELSNAARGLNFYFYFQALLPYKGSNAFAIDKVLRLQPKENLIHRYCEAKKIAESKPVLMVIDGKEFSPWIGSVKTGQITWLSSNPIRQMQNSDYVVIDMPPLATYDVYWMGQIYSKPYWSFENQDTEAYEKAVELIKAQNGIVLVDRQAELVVPAKNFITECDNAQSLLQSQLFRQMCLK